LGSLGTGTDQFEMLGGLFVNSTGQILVTNISGGASDSVIQMNNIQGAGWQSFGSEGSAAGQFSQPLGISQDSTGAIYIGDIGNCRLVRINDITGAGWISYGSCGAGVGQFEGPDGVFIK
jgi:hypothetical protein